VLEAAVPAELEDATWKGPLHQVAPSRALFSLPGVGRALVEDDRITVDADPRADPADVAWMLDRPVRELAELRAGRFALRAAAVSIGGNAVALVGHSASGKSAVAATLAQRGHPVLADHRLPVDVGGVPRALAAAPGLDLWPDVVGLLGLDADAGRVVRPALAKRTFAFPAGRAAPLTTIVALSRQSELESGGGERSRGGASIGRLHEHTAGALLLGPLGVRADHFGWMVALATGTRIEDLHTDRHRDGLDVVADRIEALVA
jgi:hypothetical protein